MLDFSHGLTSVPWVVDVPQFKLKDLELLLPCFKGLETLGQLTLPVHILRLRYLILVNRESHPRLAQLLPWRLQKKVLSRHCSCPCRILYYQAWSRRMLLCFWRSENDMNSKLRHAAANFLLDSCAIAYKHKLEAVQEPITYEAVEEPITYEAAQEPITYG